MAKEKTASDVSKIIKDDDVKLIDFKFTDLFGTWQHFTTTLTEYNEEIFTDGLGFDGSSIRGWRVINASDMLVIPDATTAWIDIFNAEPTLSLICTIVDPITRSRTIATRAVLLKKRRLISNRPASRTPHSSDRKRNFLFSMMCDLRIAGTRRHTSSIAPRDTGTARARNFQTSVTRFDRKKATFPFHRWTPCRISAMKWLWSWKKRVSLWTNSIMK